MKYVILGGRQKCITRTTIITSIEVILCFCVLLAIGGCSTSTTYVIKQDEIIKVTPGQIVTAPYSGWLLSQRAVERIMHTKVVDTNLK